jgi:5-oxoprolinase (ATP-hydrolysing)/N-methylhydantoinase A
VFAGQGSLDTAVYDRDTLRHGNVIEGPAVVEEDVSTTVIEPGDQLTVDEYGYLVMELSTR